MANQKDKFSIFLTVLIVFLIVAMGVYAFIYREKIAETIQKFTKKDNQEKVYELKTTKKTVESNEDFLLSEKKSKEGDIAFENPKSDKTKTLENPPLFEPTETKSRNTLREQEKKGNSPRLSEPEDKFLDPTQSPYRKSTKLTQSSKEEELHSEFIGKKSHLKKKFYSKKKKRYYSKARIPKSTQRDTLEARVRELEEKFGVKSNKKSNLEKRISRLEKLEKRVDRLEKIASKKSEQ